MRRFWGYVKNDRFAIGCTGQTVYVYDDMGNELKKFKDITYAYTPMFSPDNKTFVVKSTAGMLAFYSLETMELIKKFRFSKAGAQDDGFCFSSDGRYFYNIERPINSLNTCLSIYDTSDFTIVKQLFDDNAQVFNHIEYDPVVKALLVLGFMRKSETTPGYKFIGEIQNDMLIIRTVLNDKQYDYLRDYKHLELRGFAEKAIEWSGLKYRGYNLDGIEKEVIFLSDYINDNK